MEMKCMNGGIAGGLSWMESFGRIILLGLFPLTDGLSCDMWRKTAPLKYFFKLVHFAPNLGSLQNPNFHCCIDSHILPELC